MYDYFFWKDQAHEALRFEHALQAKSHTNTWDYFAILKDKTGKIRLIGSQDWEPFFYGMRCKKIAQEPHWPAMPYFVHQNSLLPIKRPVQFRDKFEDTQILPMNSVLQDFLQIPEEACLFFQWKPLHTKHSHALLRKAKHPSFKADRKLDQYLTKWWIPHPKWSRLLQGLLTKRKPLLPHKATDTRMLEQTSTHHEKESPSQALLDKLSRPMFDLRIRSSHCLESFTKHFHQAHLGHLFWQKKVASIYLSSEEFAGLLLPPNFNAFAQHLQHLNKPYFSAPPQASEYLAEDRKKHVYILGKTGMGKSSTMLQLFQADLKQGGPIVMMDPHGSLIEQAMHHIPEDQMHRLVYLRPSYHGRSPAINPLEAEGSIALQASNLVDCFRMMAQESWGPRLEYWLRNSILSLLEWPESRLEDIPKLLNDPKAFPLHQLSPVLQDFWHKEFLNLDKKIRLEACQAIFNKVGPLLTHPSLGPIFRSKETRFHFHKSFDKNQIVMIHLGKADLGEDGARFLGMLFLSQLHRSLLMFPRPYEQSVRVFLDEVQHFGGQVLESLLAEFRKYGLALSLANQHLSQLSPRLQDSILGNVGNMISFQLSYNDAKLLAPSFGLEPEHLCALSPLEAYVKRIHKGLNLPIFFYEVPSFSFTDTKNQAPVKSYAPFTRKLSK